MSAENKGAAVFNWFVENRPALVFIVCVIIATTIAWAGMGTRVDTNEADIGRLEVTMSEDMSEINEQLEEHDIKLDKIGTNVTRLLTLQEHDDR